MLPLVSFESEGMVGVRGLKSEAFVVNQRDDDPCLRNIIVNKLMKKIHCTGPEGDLSLCQVTGDH